MIFQIKHTKQGFLRENFFKIILVLLILTLVFIFSVYSPAQSLISDIFSPLFRAGNSFYNVLNRVPKFFLDKNELIKENAKLSNKIENLYSNIADYESIKYENQKLREGLGLKPAGNFITASIIAKPPQTPLDSIFLDKGTKDDISNGNFVFTGERIFIGKIAKTSKNRATVALNSFAGAITYGFVARTNEPLEIKGAGGGNIETKVPIDFDIVVGDKIMVGDSLNYLAAVVGTTEEDRSSGFKKILMSLPANISKTNIIFIEPFINE